MNIIRKIKRKISEIPLQLAFVTGFKRYGKKRISEITTKPIEIKEKANSANIRVADIYQNKTGIISIISDDGDFETAYIFNEISAEYSIPVTIAGAIKFVYPHINEWREFLASGNLNLINHSYNHNRMDDKWKYSTNKRILYHELVHSHYFLEKYFGLDDPVFVCPHCVMSDMGMDILKNNGVIAIRGYGPGINDIHISDGVGEGQWLNLKSVGIMDEPCENQSRFEMREQWLKNTKNKWLIEMWHNIDVPGFQSISKDEAIEHFKQISSAISRDNLWMAQFIDVVKYFKQRDNCELFSWYDADGICIYLRITDNVGFNDFCKMTINIPTRKRLVNATYISKIESNYVYQMDIYPNNLVKILFE